MYNDGGPPSVAVHDPSHGIDAADAPCAPCAPAAPAAPCAPSEPEAAAAPDIRAILITASVTATVPVPLLSIRADVTLIFT